MVRDTGVLNCNRLYNVLITLQAYGVRIIYALQVSFCSFVLLFRFVLFHGLFVYLYCFAISRCLAVLFILFICLSVCPWALFRRGSKILKGGGGGGHTRNAEGARFLGDLEGMLPTLETQILKI